MFTFMEFSLHLQASRLKADLKVVHLKVYLKVVHLLLGGLPVVSRNLHQYAMGEYPFFQVPDFLDNVPGHIHGIGPLFLGKGQCDGRV